MDASKLDQTELDDILRYGAEDLFADDDMDCDASAQTASKCIVWDDAALERLLDRSQVVASEEDQEEEDYLASFKVADFEMRSGDEDNKEGWDMGAGAAEAGPKVNKAAFWQDLLGDTHAQLVEERRRQAELEAEGRGKGKRVRKAINYSEAMQYRANDKRRDPDFVSDSPGGTESDDSDGGDQQEAPPPDPSKAPELQGHRIMGLNKGERRAFYKAILQHGVLPMKAEAMERAFDHLVERTSFTQQELARFGPPFVHIVNRHLAPEPLYDQEYREDSPEDETAEERAERLARVHDKEVERLDKKRLEGALVDELGEKRARKVATRIEHFLLVRTKLEQTLPDAPSVADALADGALPPLKLRARNCMLALRSLKWMTTWRAEHDTALLIGLDRHGWDEWNRILADDELGFQAVLANELGESADGEGGETKYAEFLKKRAGHLVTALTDEQRCEQTRSEAPAEEALTPASAMVHDDGEEAQAAYPERPEEPRQPDGGLGEAQNGGPDQAAQAPVQVATARTQEQITALLLQQQRVFEQQAHAMLQQPVYMVQQPMVQQPMLASWDHMMATARMQDQMQREMARTQHAFQNALMSLARQNPGLSHEQLIQIADNILKGMQPWGQLPQQH